MNISPSAKRQLAWLMGFSAVALVSLLLWFTFMQKDATLSNQAIIDAVQRGSWDAINAVPPEPRRLSEDLEHVMAQLGDEESQIATTLASRYPGPNTVPFMLKMAQSTHMQAAMTAAMALIDLPQSPGMRDLAATVARATNPMVRAQLYLVIGRHHEAESLPTLRKLLLAETDAGAREKGIAAAARLRGTAERAAFLARVSSASAANAKDVYDELLYVGDVSFAKGLLPWLDQQDPVTRIGSDVDNKAARMCDVAVWTALRLGVKLPVPKTKLAIYDDATLQVTRAALVKLPKP